MKTSHISQDHHPTVVLFPNGNRALLLAPPAGMKAADILHMLGIAQPKALILVVGGTADLDAAVQPRLVQLCSRGIARAAATLGALIIDGGTQAGVIAMMGQGVADRGRTTALLGVAPAGKVTYPDGHEEIVLNVPHYDFNWQHSYATSLKLPKGARMHFEFRYDNSANNQFNPDPSRWVYQGFQSWEEMMAPNIGFLLERDADVSNLMSLTN